MTCSVEGARPAATIDWFNRSELVDPQPVTTEELMPDSTYRYVLLARVEKVRATVSEDEDEDDGEDEGEKKFGFGGGGRGSQCGPLAVPNVYGSLSRTSSTLVFVASRFDQERDFSCVGTNAVLKEKNEVPLLDVTTLKVLCK